MPPTVPPTSITMSPSQIDDDVNIKLAIYMERLDNYIQSQTALNASICRHLDTLQKDVVEVQGWRSKMYGIKTGIMALALLVLHTSAVMGSFVVILRWWDK